MWPRKTCIIFTLAIICCFTYTNEAAQVTTTLSATADSWVLAGTHANDNHGTEAILNFQSSPSIFGYSHVLARFSQPDIVAAFGQTGTLVSATLRLYIESNSNDWGLGTNLDLYRITQNWSEAVTWNCPFGGSCQQMWNGGQHASPYTATMVQKNNIVGFVDFNVTADLNLFLAGTAQNYGWLLRKRTETAAGSLIYTSRQGTAARAPQLVLVVNHTPPTCSQTISPVPNAYQWNNSNVTVTCVCSSPDGIASCTPPQTISQEGASQTVVCQAVDVFGLSTTCSKTLNIDKTPPAVEITSPLDGAVSYDSNIDIHGFALEQVSGLTGVTCNNIYITPQEGAFQTAIQLTTQLTPITCNAFDVAGNAGSASAIVTYLDSREVLQSVAPFIIPADGQTHDVILTGTGFSTNSAVYIDNDPVPFTLVDTGHIRATVQYSESAKHSINILNTISNDFTEDPKAFLSIAAGAALPDVSSGSVAGGTRIRLYSNNGFDSGASVSFDVTDNFQCDNSRIPSESTTYIDQDTLEVTTPAAPESLSSIVITNSQKPQLTAQHAYLFVTLGYVLNSDHSISVINTSYGEPFSENPLISLGQNVVPSDIELSKGQNGGREIYIVDARSGNVLVYSAVNFNLLQTITLQNPTLPPVQKWAAFDIEVSADGAYAYVIHATDGLAGANNGSVSVINLNTHTVIDLDANSSTTSSGAPQGVTRIEGMNSITPLSSKILALPISTPHIGDRWPGEYMYVSTVSSTGFTFLPICPSPDDPLHCGTAITDVSSPTNVKVVDLNPSVVVGYSPIGDVILGPNPGYRTILTTINLSSVNQMSGLKGLFFDGFVGSNGRPYVYAGSDGNNQIIIIDVQSMSLLAGNSTITTGNIPTGMAIQTVALGSGTKTLAYVVNSADNTTMLIDTSTNTPLSASSIPLSGIESPGRLLISPRNTGDRAFVVSSLDNAVTLLDLEAGSELSALTLSTGANPTKIILQRVPPPPQFNINAGSPGCVQTSNACHITSITKVKFSSWVRFQAMLAGNCNPGGGNHFAVQYFVDGVEVGYTMRENRPTWQCSNISGQVVSQGPWENWVFTSLSTHTVGARLVEYYNDPIEGRQCFDWSNTTTSNVTLNGSGDADQDGISTAVENTLMASFVPVFHKEAAESDTVTSITARVGPLLDLGGRGMTSRVIILMNYNVLWDKDDGCIYFGGHLWDTEPMAYFLTGTDPNVGGWNVWKTKMVAHDGTVAEHVDTINGYGNPIYMSHRKHGLWKGFCDTLCDNCDSGPIPSIVPHNVGNTSHYPANCAHTEHLMNDNYVVPSKWSSMRNHFGGYYSPFSDE